VTLQQMIDESSRIVFFGGAGVSTESGISDFRSADGLYRKSYAYPPEQMLSHSFYVQHPEAFFRFYRSEMMAMDAQPNAAHHALAALERTGKLTAVITQNIDGLHQKAGSQRVLELHGSIWRNYCESCGKLHSAAFVHDAAEDVPRCACGGVVKPDVVLYEETLDSDVLESAIAAIRAADMLIIAGTSMTVYPAAGLVQYFRGKHLVLINRDTTPVDDVAELVLRKRVGEVLGQLKIRGGDTGDQA